MSSVGLASSEPQLTAAAAAIPEKAKYDPRTRALIEGPIANAWHGADIAYFVNLLVAAVGYSGYRLVAARPRTTGH